MPEICTKKFRKSWYTGKQPILPNAICQAKEYQKNEFSGWEVFCQTMGYNSKN